jgi:hypothetical protein
MGVFQGGLQGRYMCAYIEAYIGEVRYLLKAEDPAKREGRTATATGSGLASLGAGQCQNVVTVTTYTPPEVSGWLTAAGSRPDPDSHHVQCEVRGVTT